MNLLGTKRNGTTSKWPGGEIPLAIKKCIESSSDKHQLDRRTPYGTARYSSTGSRRICHVLRPKWCTVRRYSCQAISFFLKLRKILPRWCLDYGYVHTVTFSHRFLLFHNPKGVPIYFQTIENDAKTLSCAHSLRNTMQRQQFLSPR